MDKNPLVLLELVERLGNLMRSELRKAGADESLQPVHVQAMLYLAHANRGWALFKKGDVRGGMESIQMAVTTNPKFCLGYKNLGLIHDEQGRTDLACDHYGRFRDACPDAAEAYYREGVCLAKLGKTEEARKDFAACQTKSVPPGTRDFKADCKQLLEKMQ